MELYYHVYVSSAKTAFSKEDLVALLNQSRINNFNSGVTGMLLYKDGNFLQVVEGPEATVRGLLAKIEKDPRHSGILVLIDGYSETRQFVDWSMGFRDLNSPEVKALPSYSEFLNTPLTSDEFKGNPTRCQKLLSNFKKVMR